MTHSSLRVYILALVLLAQAAWVVVPSVRSFRNNRGCQGYFDLATQYGFRPKSCFQYSLDKYVVPAMAMASPFVFVALVMLWKERRQAYLVGKLRQQALAYWLVMISSLMALLSFAVIGSIRCEGFGCLGLAPMVATTSIVVPPLVCGVSLWFLAARYQWSPRLFLATSIGVSLCLMLAYSQTPGL